MKGSTWAYGMVRDGNGSRISRPITERTWASSTSTISRCPVSICVVMVRYSFRSRLRLVTVASRRFRTPAGAAARFVAEGLVLRPPTAAQRCTNLPHAPGWHLDAQISAQIYRSVGDELYPGRLLGLLTRTLLQPVVKRSARAATHDLRHPLRGSTRRSAGIALCRRRLSRQGRCTPVRGRSPFLLRLLYLRLHYLQEASGS